MKKYKVMAGMLFSFEAEVTAKDHQDAVERMLGFIETTYKGKCIYDDVNEAEFEFIRPTTIIVEDEKGNVQDFQFKELN